MAKIPDEIIKLIESTAKIQEVVGDFVQLRKTGVRYTGICPFHDDRHDGNFIVYPKDNCYRCFTCDAKGGAINFLMNNPNIKMTFLEAVRYLGRKYNIETDNIPFDYTPPPLPPPPPPRPTLILPRAMVSKRTGNLREDNLARWIANDIRWGEDQRQRICQVLHDYCVGHVTISQRDRQHDFTVFWQIDSEGRPRTAHYMKYKPNGKRIHKEEDSYNTDWFHSLLERSKATEYYDPERQEARQCLFGEHLLKRYPDAPVCLVESEKTALIAAIAYGNNKHHLWMACCGSSNITRERLRPLIADERRIILYPDRDGIPAWKAKADNIHYKGMAVDATPVTQWWRPCDGPKADLADVVVRSINQPDSQQLADMMSNNPNLKKLVKSIDLELHEEEETR